MLLRRLNETDLCQVDALDAISCFDVYFFVSDHDEPDAWGIFDGEKLIGYASMGYTDSCGPTIEFDSYHTVDSRILSSVFILEEYRTKGYASQLVSYVLDQYKDVSIYLTILEDDLDQFYAKFGFVPIGYGCMRKV